MTRREKSDIKRKLNVINYAKEVGNINKACRHYGVSKTIYFKWIKKLSNIKILSGITGSICLSRIPIPENNVFWI